MSFEGIQYLILGTIVGGTASSVLHSLTKVASDILWATRECVFQYVAPRFGISEEYFSAVANLSTMARILKELGLRTHRHTWLHDANPDAGDSTQYGFLRLPTRSWTLKALSFCKVTHYIEIAHNAAHVSAVGNTAAIYELMRVSKRASSRKTSEEELTNLRHAFGLGAAWTPEDLMCARLERCVVTVFFVVCGFVKLCLTDDIVASTDAQVGLSILWLLAGCLCVQYIVASLGHGVPMTSSEYAVVASTEPTDAENFAQAITEPLVARVEPNRPQYYVFLARSYYFEIRQQMSRRSQATRISGALSTAGHKVYAVPSVPQFLDDVARRFSLASDAILYIGTHNPFNDPPLQEAIDLVQKADKIVVFVVILPPLESFTAALATNTNSRMHTAKCSQFVSTLADFESLLMTMTSGVMHTTIFVFPFNRFGGQSALQQNSVWRACCQIVVSEVIAD